MIHLVAPHRGQDAFGLGSFGAPRGKRTHNGIDFAAAAGSGLKSPVTGTVTKHGLCYAETMEFRYIEITDINNYRHRFFYVSPLAEVDTQVSISDVIGRIQNISRYHEAHDPDRKMINHLHYEVKTPQGEYINPGELNGNF